MEIADAVEFVRGHRDAVMLTRRRDGSPQLSPVTCSVDATDTIVISTRETALKVKNLRRDPHVSLCVLAEGFYGKWIQVDGTAEIVSLPDALEPLVEYYRSLRGDHPDWDEYRAAMVTDQRCLLRITVERAGPDVSG
ncbi:MAG: PPOX class F420-dependent oxidoreductase [Acidimicrobiia bacterium]